MQAIIPMAGYGTRLRPHTFSRPKPLLNVAGQTMLDHLLDSLKGAAIDEYVFIVGYLGEQIEAYVAKHYDIKAIFVTQEEMLGQAHAIHLCKERLNGPGIVVFSDTLFEADLTPLGRETVDGVAYVKEVDDPRRFGVAELNEQGFVTRFVEKPESLDNKRVVVGLYYIRDTRWMIRAIETLMARKQMTKGEYYIADAFQVMVDEGAKFRTEPVSVWLDCGKPETMLETNHYLLAHGHDNSASIQCDRTVIIPPVRIHPDATIENAIIGPDVAIASGCHIRNSVIRNSIVDEGARITDAILTDSLIGQDAQIRGRHQVLIVGDSSSVKFS